MSKINEKIFEDIFKNGLVIVFSFLISTGLLGGCSYILFDSEAEWQKLSEYPTRVAEQNKDIQPYGEMGKVISSGWLMSEQNITDYVTIVNYMTDFQSAPTLDKTFVSNTISWVEDSERQLRKERGLVSGYTFEDDLLTKHQKSQIEIYDLQIAANSQLKDMVINWESLSPDQRGLNAESLKENISQINEKLSAFQAESSQVVEQLNLKQAKLRDEYNNTFVQYTAYQRRVFLAKAGITVGVILLILSLWSGYKYYFVSGSAENTKGKTKKEKSK